MSRRSTFHNHIDIDLCWPEILQNGGAGRGGGWGGESLHFIYEMEEKVWETLRNYMFCLGNKNAISRYHTFCDALLSLRLESVKQDFNFSIKENNCRFYLFVVVAK